MNPLRLFAGAKRFEQRFAAYIDLFPLQFESKLFRGVKVIDYLFGRKLHFSRSKTQLKKATPNNDFCAFVGVKSH